MGISLLTCLTLIMKPKKKPDNSSNYKYLLHHYLNQLPHAQYKVTVKQLPKKLGVSAETFRKWKYIKVNTNATIPSDKLAIIAIFFNLRIEELFNYSIPSIKYDELLDADAQEKTKTYEKDSQRDA